MNNTKIKLMDPKEVAEFVNIASKYDFDIDIKGAGNVYVDGKSFLGLMTQGLKRELLVICRGTDESFDRSIRKFAVA